MSLHSLRREYARAALLESRSPNDPWTLFDRWFRARIRLRGHDPNAVALSTADRSGRPSSRMVLLKRWDERGFVFATNYESRKGRELVARPHAALLFYWPELERQVRIEGRVSRASAAESDAIFGARPRTARIAANISPQSRVLAGRRTLELAFALGEAALRGVDVTRPAHWGALRLRPVAFEFWQGRANRLHDRLRYLRVGGRWRRERLAP